MARLFLHCFAGCNLLVNFFVFHRPDPYHEFFRHGYGVANKTQGLRGLCFSCDTSNCILVLLNFYFYFFYFMFSMEKFVLVLCPFILNSWYIDVPSSLGFKVEQLRIGWLGACQALMFTVSVNRREWPLHVRFLVGNFNFNTFFDLSFRSRVQSIYIFGAEIMKNQLTYCLCCTAAWCSQLGIKSLILSNSI